MKNIPQLTASAVLLLASCVMLLASCSKKEKSVVDTIPANATWAVCVNVEDLLSNAGVKETDGKYRLSRALEDLTSTYLRHDNEVVDKMLEGIPAIDAEAVYFYADYKDRPILTCGLRHAEPLVNALRKNFGPSVDKNGYTIFGANGNIIAIRDNQLWVSDKTAYIVEAVEEAVKNGSIRSWSNFNAITEGDHTILALGKVGAFLSMAGYKNASTFIDLNADASFYVDFKDNTMIIGSECDESVIKESFNKSMSDISADALKYVPENSIMAMAVGSLNPADAEILFGNASNSPLESILDGMIGTIAVSIQPPSDMNDLLSGADWDFNIVTRMTESAAGDLDNLIRQFFNVTEREGCSYFTWGNKDFIGGARLYYRYCNDSYLVMGSEPVSDNNKSIVTRGMERQPWASQAHLDKDSDIARVFNLPFGIDIRSRTFSGSHRIEWVITLEGSDKPFIDALLALAADRKWQRDVMNRLMWIRSHILDIELN
ncbi:MAG: hypothetical protein NC082_02530 [Clostridiales bacterium]|nr:hypothetical protein [Clostridiales bacterium]